MKTEVYSVVYRSRVTCAEKLGLMNVIHIRLIKTVNKQNKNQFIVFFLGTLETNVSSLSILRGLLMGFKTTDGGATGAVVVTMLGIMEWIVRRDGGGGGEDFPDWSAAVSSSVFLLFSCWSLK